MKNKNNAQNKQKSGYENNSKANNVSNSGKIRIYFGENNEYLAENTTLGDNKVSTTKYQLLTFFPKSIILQFQKAANVYFLIVSILSCMPFSPKESSSMIFTLAFVLIATQVKEAIEDLGRYKQDRFSNNKIVLKLWDGAWTPVKCHSIYPGDIIKIFKEEEIFSDCLIIKSANESGYCFVDTKNLDGETNLKEKCSVEEFKHMNEKNFINIIGSIDCDKPNEHINNWEGLLTYSNINTYTSLKNMFLKGSILKNTEYVIGIVIYTGKNTKIMKNSKQATIKTSKILQTMNKLLYSLFIFNILLCVLFAILSLSWYNRNRTACFYIYGPVEANDNPKYSPVVNFVILFFTFFITFAQIIPISLYVVMEIIKIIQGILVYYDSEIYDDEFKRPTNARTTDLIEELGQVEFIFSDKTGTLTQNNMILKKCYVNKKIYGVIKQKDEDAKFTVNGDISISKKILSNEDDDRKDKESLINFFYLLTLCHSVFPEKTDRGIIYQGSSPDDVALVQGAKQLGFEFLSKEYDDLIIKNHLTNEKIIWEQICELPFDSDRKRMSVIVRNKTTKKILLLTKGADNIMLSESRIKYDIELYEEIDKVINVLSKEGLRTLVMGMKILDENHFEYWLSKYNEAKNYGKDLNPMYEQIEKELDFVGCSAVEDKLQDGVPETIHTLINCNIKFFVLTGDKQDTAIEIAKSCRLINENMQVIILSTDLDKVNDRLREIIIELKLKYPFYDNDEASNQNNSSSNNSKNYKYYRNGHIDIKSIAESMKENFENDLSIVIDGATLDMILGNKEYSKMFLLISIAAKSVICCRVSPKQKAKVVKLIKQNGPWITLSIGDGANDVPMILEAHLGIGIIGKEGTQAVRSADYAIGQFRFLEKLLLFHGRNGYLKISKFICYYFYKNIFLVFTEMFFSIFNGFSGQIFFADYLSTLFNAVFTSWPCVFTFIFEKDHDTKVCKKFPILYRAGQINYYFNLREFWKYILYAITHATMAFFIPTIIMSNINDSQGDQFNSWHISSLSFSIVINVTMLKLLVISDFWNGINIFFSIFSIGFYYGTIAVMGTETISKIFQNEIIGIFGTLLANVKSFMLIVIAPIICLLPDIMIKQLYYNLYPTPAQYVEKYKHSIEFQTIINSESNFLKSLSNLHSDPSHKIRIINVNHQNVKLEPVKKCNKTNI